MLTQQWTLILMLSFPWQFAVSSAIITLCTMTTLFQYSDKLLVFDYFFTFGLSAITMSFPISTFFTRAKTAIAVGTLSFIGAFFHYYTVNNETVSMSILLLLRHFSNNFSSGNNETAFYTCRVLKVMASFLSPTSFALGSIKFADYERGHVGLRWSNIWRESSGVCFLVCLLMMLFDTVLYGAVGLYLDKVLSRENGLHFPWNPTFWKSFWRKKNTREHYASTSEVNLIDNSDKESENLFGEPVRETISLEMKQQQIDGRCIQIRNLQKVYSTNRGTVPLLGPYN